VSKFTFSVSKTSLDKLKSDLAQVSKGMTQSESSKVGSYIVEEMKNMVEVGLSPILGNGRFPAYKNPNKYPGNRKPQRPVNLFLTGDFLNDLKSRNTKTTTGYVPVILFETKESQDKELGHRTGWNGQPKRPIIPDQRRNEQFAKVIEVGIIDRLKQILSNRLSRK
jgi:hypothetical protein